MSVNVNFRFNRAVVEAPVVIDGVKLAAEIRQRLDVPCPAPDVGFERHRLACIIDRDRAAADLDAARADLHGLLARQRKLELSDSKSAAAELVALGGKIDQATEFVQTCEMKLAAKEEAVARRRESQSDKRQQAMDAAKIALDAELAAARAEALAELDRVIADPLAKLARAELAMVLSGQISSQLQAA